MLKAADLLNQAVAHDPTFFQAYCQLAWTHDNIYFDRLDRTPARLALAGSGHSGGVSPSSRCRRSTSGACVDIFIGDTAIMMAPWLKLEIARQRPAQ